MAARSAVAIEHRLLVFQFWLAVSVDRLDPTQVESLEHAARRILQIQKAVRKSPKNPDFTGLEPYLRHVADPSGGATTLAFDAHVADVLRAEGAWLKQSRLAKEEQDALEKRKKKKDGKDGEA